MATGTGLSPYKGILSANLYERLEDELRARPTVLIPPQHNGDASSPSPTSNSTGSATASESGNLHHRASSSRDSPSTPHPNGYLSTIQENGEYDTNTNTSGARGNGNGSARGVEVAEGTRMAASDYLSHAIAMATTYKPVWWISAWFALTIPIIFWDAGYCFMRPRSMFGGDLHWIWSPYALYQNVDLVYGVRAFEEGDGFTNAQSLLNVIENLMNMYYLYLAHYAQSPVAPVLGFASIVMTLSKTVLYWAQEYYCGFCAIGHNDIQTILLLWVLPNGLWLLVPSMIAYRFAKDISASIRVASAVAASKRQ